MSDDIKQTEDTSAAEFKQGVEAAGGVSRNRQAENELSRELQTEGESQEAVVEILHKEPLTPLFVSDGSGGDQGNAQDEKDEAAE